MNLKADVVILGCGFAGSLTGTIIRRLGLSVVIVDRDVHPRFAIGESSTPAADRILRRLCDRYDLPRLRPLSTWGTWQQTYPQVMGGIKRGFSYFHHQAGVPFTPDCVHANELLAAASSDDESSDTQWYRADVDALFAAEAARAGAVVLEKTVIEHIRHEDGWHFSGIWDGRPVHVDATFAIDATGAAGVLSHHLGLENRPMRTHSRALFGHFTGVPRWRTYVRERAARISDYPFDPDFSAMHHVLDGAWMWMLRFKNERVSAGFAIDETRHSLDPSITPEAEFNGLLDRYPSLRALFSDAEPASPPGRIIRTGRLQRRTVPCAGPDWALLPHTAGFVDPLHSTGIAHSLFGLERLVTVLGRWWDHPTRAVQPTLKVDGPAPGFVPGSESERSSRLGSASGYAPDSGSASVAGDSAASGHARAAGDSAASGHVPVAGHVPASGHAPVSGLARALEEYSRGVSRELEFIDLLVSCCYRSMPNFRLWTASTMLYLAAATTFERLQSDPGVAGSGHLFLLADEAPLFASAAEALRILECDRNEERYERFVRNAIAPYNHVGLFSADPPNMYRHTAAQSQSENSVSS